MPVSAPAVTKPAADGFTWSFAGERKLKGVQGGVKLFRARREGARAG